MRRILLTILLCWSSVVWADDVITIHSAADIPPRRAALLQNSMETPSLPTTLPVVTEGVASTMNPILGSIVARVDRYEAQMSNGQVNISDFYLSSRSNNRVVAINMGHQGICAWAAFAPAYGTMELMRGLLRQGYNVFAMNMPNCGLLPQHNLLGTTFNDIAMQYFHLPLTQAINYWQQNYNFTDYNMAGLSGGGWTSWTYPAIDPRIRVSISVAGGLAGIAIAPMFVNSANRGDWEQWAPGYYGIAGVMDQYLMASQGVGRVHQQILNMYDDCCFGQDQWRLGFDFQTYFSGKPECDNASPCLWRDFVSSFSRRTVEASANIQPAVFRPVLVDRLAASHQISRQSREWILAILQSTAGTATGGGRRRIW